jgi:hypothetical protein
LALLILKLNDPEFASRGAHLQWFICAHRCRGTGIGRTLLAKRSCMPVRILSSEAEGDAWGTIVKEQEYRKAGHSPL